MNLSYILVFIIVAMRGWALLLILNELKRLNEQIENNRRATTPQQTTMNRNKKQVTK